MTYSPPQAAYPLWRNACSAAQVKYRYVKPTDPAGLNMISAAFFNALPHFFHLDSWGSDRYTLTRESSAMHWHSSITHALHERFFNSGAPNNNGLGTIKIWKFSEVMYVYFCMLQKPGKFTKWSITKKWEVLKVSVCTDHFIVQQFSKSTLTSRSVANAPGTTWAS